MRILVLLLLSFACAIEAIAGLTLVRDGRPRAVIVIAVSPTASAQRAAQDLQHFLELISGAKLPILNGDATSIDPGTAILAVGRSALTAGLPIPSDDDRDHTREGFLLKTRGHILALAGNEEWEYRGTEYAVYELLGRLGCRWFFPGAFGQVIPKRSTIVVPALDTVQRPSFAVRNIWTSSWADLTGEIDEFLIRNKGTLRGAYAFPGDGSIQNLAPLAKYAKLYPEIYAMGKDGKRQDENTAPEWTMLCTTSPKAVETAANSIADYFLAHPEANSYGFSAPDNNAVCYCPACVARMHDILLDSGIGESISDPYFNFVNNLAWKVNERFPDKYLVVLAYASRVSPPEGLDRPWNPHIIIQLAQLRVSALHPLGTPTDFSSLRQLRILRSWSRITPTMLIYDYDPHADLSRMPFWRSRAIAADMKLYRANHVVGFTTEGNNTFFRTGLNYYIRAKCMWDVNADVNALLDDFYASFFGPAAAPMKRFCEGIEAMMQASPDHISWQPHFVDWRATYPPERVASLGRLLDQAEHRATTPEIRTRIRLYRLLHDYMTANLQVFDRKARGDYMGALAELEKLPRLTADAEAIQKGLLPPDPDWVLKEGSGIEALRATLGTLILHTDGKHGEPLALAPETARFLRDPRNIGLYEQWQRDDVADVMQWETIDVTRDWGQNGHRDRQGYAFDDIGWYRIVMPVSKSSGGRAQLLVPLVFAEKMWVWINGQLVYTPTTPNVDAGREPGPGMARWVNRRGYASLALDIQDCLKPGAENTFTFRLSGSLDRVHHRGLADRPLVWAPLP